MRSIPVFFSVLLCVSLFSPSSVEGKEGVQATLHTSIVATAVEGSQIDVSWSLKHEESGEPFNACAVFIRLIGASGESTEAFAECGANADGRYDATATVPNGGVVKIEIGVAGTMTDRGGNAKRSDWLMPLANDPLHD